MNRQPQLAKWQPIKSKAYRWFYRSIAPCLGDSLPAIRFKWLVAMKLVGLEFHLQNITQNRDKLLRYLEPDRPVLESIADVISNFEDESILLLDLGCGPFSKAGTRLPGKQILKELLDPLASNYRAFYAEFQVPHQPQIRPGFAEKLSDYYPLNHFHVIYAQNCIDHCYNPMLAFREMLRVLRPRGCIVMQHFLSEGTRAGGYGLHQWNLALEGGDLRIRNRNASIIANLTQEHRDTCTIESHCNGEKLFCRIHKL